MKPADVKTDFTSGLTDVTSFYATATSALASDKDQTFLVENTFLAAAVLWESFLSDLIIAYINRDSSQFSVHLRNALETDMTAKQKRIYSAFATLTIPTHLNKADVIALIDGQGNNISFSNFNDLNADAARWLVAADAAKIANLTAAQQATINALTAVRNQIAHRSKRAHEAMKIALSAGAMYPTGLQRGGNAVNHIGAYLKARPQGHTSKRIEIFLSQMQTIATAL